MSVKIALAGNPNSGKTTLFNALTGSNQYVDDSELKYKPFRSLNLLQDGSHLCDRISSLRYRRHLQVQAADVQDILQK